MTMIMFLADVGAPRGRRLSLQMLERVRTGLNAYLDIDTNIKEKYNNLKHRTNTIEKKHDDLKTR